MLSLGHKKIIFVSIMATERKSFCQRRNSRIWVAERTRTSTNVASTKSSTRAHRQHRVHLARHILQCSKSKRSADTTVITVCRVRRVVAVRVRPRTNPILIQIQTLDGVNPIHLAAAVDGDDDHVNDHLLGQVPVPFQAPLRAPLQARRVAA